VARRRRPWTRDRIIRALQADARRRGRPPTASEWKRGVKSRRRPTWGTVRSVFGSWEAALEAAAFDPEQQWTERRILDALWDWEREHGRPPVHNEWLRADRGRRRPTAETCKAVFGSWNAALEAAGFKPRGPADRPSRRAA
jgi:HNH endonuclease